MSAQDNMEKVLRELHVLLSKSNPYERDSNYLVVNKKEVLDILKQKPIRLPAWDPMFADEE